MATPAKRPKQDFSHIFNDPLCTNCKSSLSQKGFEKPRWYRCKENHHLFCQDCAGRHGSHSRYGNDWKCPGQDREGYVTKPDTPKPCKSYIYMKAGHCQVIEALLNSDKMQVKCKNLDRGCQETLDKEKWDSHLAECIYRPVKCPHIACGSQVPFNELVGHMTQDNGCIGGSYTTMFFKRVWSLTTPYQRRMPLKIEIDGKVFFFVSTTSGNNILFWIQFLGTPIEAKNYSYTLEFKSQTSPTDTLFYNGQISSVDENSGSIIQQQNCFGVWKHYFDKKFVFCDDNDESKIHKFRVEIKIRNLKEEVKDDNVESGVSDTDE